MIPGTLHAGALPRSAPGQSALPPEPQSLSLIGKGGMGDVYKARHRKMERTVALKVINRGLVRKAEAIDRFHREVKTAAQLSHPNIVTAYDADQAGDFHFMVMEYVDGVDLSKRSKSMAHYQSPKLATTSDRHLGCNTLTNVAWCIAISSRIT